jgi:2'-hydroxyisoflavone reductase
LPAQVRVFLGDRSRAIGGKARIVWMDGDFLRTEQHIRSFDQLPYWNPDRPGFEQIATAKAHRAGFSMRPLGETAKDAWASYQKLFPSGVTYSYKQYTFEWGISPEREREILAAWKQKKAAGSYFFRRDLKCRYAQDAALSSSSAGAAQF